MYPQTVIIYAIANWGYCKIRFKHSVQAFSSSIQFKMIRVIGFLVLLILGTVGTWYMGIERNIIWR